MSNNSSELKPMLAVTAAVGAGGLAVGLFTFNPFVIGLSVVGIVANLRENKGRVLNRENKKGEKE